ncbi:Nif3-like dinuclear metal center hexameric protein [Magnetofaba australis]|nr:Nif3-like dinuclear metal center hexameric protein [Magnetofaba australis]
MAHLSAIESHLLELLNVSAFDDYCPNGVQVRGGEEVTTLVTGVSASVALFEAALAHNAQLIITHHGMFWNKDSRVVEGQLKQRLKPLLLHDVTLMGFHLPLDAHPELGNNAQLLKMLELEPGEPFAGYRGSALSRLGRWRTPRSAEQVKALLVERLGAAGLFLEFGPEQIQTVAICSGGAPELIAEAQRAGADLYLTGEASEPVYHFAQEMGMHFVAAGHHSTERFGVQALGEHLAQEFGLTHHYVELNNPI